MNGKCKYPKTKEQLETQSVVIAGREYKRQSEFFDFCFSTTDNAVEKYENDFYIDGDLVLWKSNDREPFGDMLLDFYEAGLITWRQVVRTCEKKEKETDEFWENVFSAQDMKEAS